MKLKSFFCETFARQGAKLRRKLINRSEEIRALGFYSTGGCSRKILRY